MSNEFVTILGGTPIAAAQNQKEATANAAHDRIVSSINKTRSFAGAVGTTVISAENFRTYGIHIVTGALVGSPAFQTLSFPATDRLFSVVNDMTAGSLIITNGVGGSVTLGIGESAILISHPTGGIFGAGGGGSGGVAAGAQIGYARTTSSTAASTTGSIPVDNTIPQNTEGAALSALDTAITVQEAASLLEIEVTLPLVSVSASSAAGIALFRDSTADALSTVFKTVNSSTVDQMVIRAVVAAGSAGATTFKLRYGSQSGQTVYINSSAGSALGNGTILATMTVKEIKQ